MTNYIAKWPNENGLIEWSDTENNTWRELITRQNQVVQNRACDEFIAGLQELQLPLDFVPQLSTVNKIFQKTGWEMTPVHGTVQINEFFTMLKNREFPVANFIRIPEELDYLQQPDVFHELFGHGPLLLNQTYADFMQWYGAMALEFTPKKRKILSRLFWYTIEFGLLETNQGLRIFGGGILSSYAETKFCLESDKPRRFPFDISKVLKTDYDYKNIPIKAITVQYVQYVELMQELQLELAAEYLLMAAMLAEIKSRLLLPRMPSEDENEVDDPRAELIRRLQMYECYKKAAQDLESLKQVDRDVFLAAAIAPPTSVVVAHPNVPMQDLLDAFVGVMTRARLFADHKVERQVLSIRERMSKVLDMINATEFTPFCSLFTVEEGRMGVVVTFIAILELIRQSVIEIVQNEPYAPIYIKSKEPRASASEVDDAASDIKMCYIEE